MAVVNPHFDIRLAHIPKPTVLEGLDAYEDVSETDLFGPITNVYRVTYFD